MATAVYELEVTASNIAGVKDAIGAADQASEVEVGEVISHWPTGYDGMAGHMTVWIYAPDGTPMYTAAFDMGGDSVWGDWFNGLLVTDGDERYDRDGRPVPDDDMADRCGMCGTSVELLDDLRGAGYSCGACGTVSSWPAA